MPTPSKNVLPEREEQVLAAVADVEAVVPTACRVEVAAAAALLTLEVTWEEMQLQNIRPHVTITIIITC